MLKRKIIQKTGLNVDVYILNSIKEIIVERLDNSTLITAGVLTFVRMKKAVEALAKVLRVF